jgi:N-methylhydantoinase A
MTSRLAPFNLSRSLSTSEEPAAGALGYRNSGADSRTAKGVLIIANLTMSSIIKKVSIARGYDPRDFTLFCYGGGGPLHGVELARALKIPRVIVPPEPGNFSALGMVLADSGRQWSSGDRFLPYSESRATKREAMSRE